ncbi:hypothetical protein [Erwinia aphidicola]|uniref:hypothetical protein n=1 Tax=Erwinia aphidicola TaxID=68334 RepID=UPI003CF84C85
MDIGFYVNRQAPHFSRHAPVRVIAITGCDGAGKSTLAASLVSHLSLQEPTELLYLGQSSGRISEWISRIPIIGASFGYYLQKKASQVHHRRAQPPDAVTALVIFLLSCWRAYKFLRMLSRCKNGCLLVTDRYPQAEVAGFRFDGPQLDKTAGGSWWVSALRKREKKIYQWMASYPPLLLIRLNVDAGTAQARKPDHALSSLREKSAVIPHLTFNGATICDLNGLEAADKILAKSLRVINASLASPGIQPF